MSTRCRHNGTWLVAGGAYEWCYECGAFRTMRDMGINNVTPSSPWCKPVGIRGANPWEAWHKRRATYRRKRGIA